MALKYVIWGCGFRGKNLCNIIPQNQIMAFVDANKSLSGGMYNGLPIISYDDYLKNYQDCIMIISPFWPHNKIAGILDRDNVPYLRTDILPPEICETVITDLFLKLDEKFFNENSILLYGLNLFSLLLRDYLTTTERSALIVPENDCSQTLLHTIKLNNPDCIGSTINENAVLYITGDFFNRNTIPACRQIDLFDFKDIFPEYYNPELEKYRNMHKGKRCFVLGTGPSLRIEDLDLLKDNNEICIASNGIFTAYESTKWRPDFYFIEDKEGYRVWKNSLLKEGYIDQMFAADYCLAEDQGENPFISFHVCKQYIGENCPAKFSSDFSTGAYWASTITYFCIQFAFFLGCTEIYLLGIDFTYSQKNNHFTQNYLPPEKSDYIDQTQHSAEIFPVMYEGYKTAASVAASKGIKLMNASRSTMLDAIERIDFDSLFDKNS
ncbi:hypothetical protein C819_02030 [Lachnospiraceae bacterium 10-1]|nr:hypothetical protein C819_02030 [Lachnospiraceae bacterium 10-1]